MCGISGFYDLGGRSSEIILKRMNDSLDHRGPDGEGLSFIETDGIQAGLSHKRLSVIDLTSAGAQPMTIGELIITFNGEIFNFREIRKELETKGVVFKSNSDTEVILKAYQAWGNDCVNKFIGMFAFVIYNSQKREFYCVRDRAGIKPFFYYWRNGLFLFASELKAFHQHPSFERELDPNAISSFMQFGNVPAQHCIYKNCNKLLPGHYLLLSEKTNGPKTTRYWNVYDHYNQPKLNISFEEAKQKTEEILLSAFQYRMVSDVPIGIFLSGGYDSACLTALLQKNSSKKLNTFTIAVPDLGLDESPFAKAIANYLGTEHHEYLCSEKEAVEIVPQLPFFYDEPFGDQSAIPTTLVSRMARKKVTVALSADAGDEIFAGYNRYDYLMKFGGRLRRTPASVRNLMGAMMKAVPAEKIPFARSSYNFPQRYEKLKLLLKEPTSRNMMMVLSKQFSTEELNDLLLAKVNSYDETYLSEEMKKEFFTPLSYMMAIDYQTYLPDDILQKVDRASMSCSLEAREPFLDHRVIEWAARLPDDHKYHNGEKKYILKAITHKHIPKHLMERPKMGFAIPIEKWLRSSLKPLLDQYLDSNAIAKEGIFNDKKVNSLVKSFYSGRTELTQKIWYLLMFRMWHEKWKS
jgi:asparagine synthase (glutamine-hydrolysing)